MDRSVPPYRRDVFTWTAFAALFAFGFLNAVLGPALPYLRSVEDLSYLAGALHQVAFAVGGGLAGAVSSRRGLPGDRRAGIVGGLVGAGLAGLALGYGTTPPVTVAAALAMGLLATSALIRVWAALADAHGPRRAVAMSEGEVAVSLAGITTPLLIGALATTAATWRLAFPAGLAIAVLAAILLLRTHVPSPSPADRPERPAGVRLQPTLVMVFAIVGLEFALSFWLASYLDDDVGLPRGTAVAAVSLLYAGNLAGRLLASRLTRERPPEQVLVAFFALCLAGLPLLLAATAMMPALAGVVLAGTGIGALFPLTSSLHVTASAREADSSLGQVLAAAAPGQITGPLLAGAVAQVATLRVGLLVLPALALLAAGGLVAHRRRR